MYFAANTEEGIKASDIANRYVSGEISYENAQFLLREECKFNRQQAKDFLRNAVESE